MKIRGMFWWLQAITFSFASLATAEPSLVYDNGPVVGPDSWGIGGYTTSDSFTVPGPTILSSAQAYTHAASGRTPTTIQWRIGTTSGGAEISSGSANIADTYLGGSVHESNFEISGNLAGAGTYYLTLTGARTSVGGYDVYWWVSDGPSTAYQVDYGWQIPSEAFRLYGETVCKDQTLCNDPGQCGATVSSGPLATTNWPGYVVTLYPPLGSLLPVGTNTVTWTAFDAVSGQLRNTCNLLVTVRDCEPPVMHSVSANPASLWPPNHKMKPVALSVSATDNCHVARSRIISVSSNEPANSDWEITGDLTLNLRAERSGNTPRIYNITVESSDDFGNTSSAVISLAVQR